MSKEENIAEREAAKLARGEVQATIASTKAEIVTVKSTTTKAMIEHEIALVQRNPIWRRTRQCSDATRPDSIKFCKTHAEALTRLTRAPSADQVAKDVQRLETTLRGHHGRLAAMGTIVLARKADPVAEMWAELLGISQEVATMMPLVMGVLCIEFFATLGGVFFGRRPHIPARPAKKKAKANVVAGVAEAPAPAEEPEDCPVREWVEAAVVKRSGSRIPSTELRKVYNQYAEHHGLPQLSMKAFGTKLGDAGYKRHKSDVTYYLNIAWRVAATPPQLKLVAS